MFLYAVLHVYTSSTSRTHRSSTSVCCTCCTAVPAVLLYQLYCCCAVPPELCNHPAGSGQGHRVTWSPTGDPVTDCFFYPVAYGPPKKINLHSSFRAGSRDGKKVLLTDCGWKSCFPPHGDRRRLIPCLDSNQPSLDDRLEPTGDRCHGPHECHALE